MRFVVIIMTGIGFTFGVLIGLFLQLPVNTLPADDSFVSGEGRNFRSRRSLNGLDSPQGQFTLTSDASFHGKDTGAKPIPIRATDQVIGLGAIVRSSNHLNTKDSAFLDVQGKHPGRTLDHVQSDYKESKHSLHSSHDIRPPGGSDTGGAVHPGRAQASLSVSVRVKSNNRPAELDSEKSFQKGESKHTGNSDQVLASDNITSGIHWSRELEQRCPGGFSDTQSNSWRIKIKSSPIVKMEEGCGRMQNRLVTFDDASKACVRYRLNTDQIQGEIYSYYLAKLLNMTNLPPSALDKVDRVDGRWKSVHLDIADSQWADGKLVILTQWIDHLSPAFIPDALKEDTRRVHPDQGLWKDKPFQDVCDLMQWSDLIVFDYLTANLDRMVNNMFNRQWNENMMNNPAHNLERTGPGNLVFLDNESGLFHGYRLLDKYASYHTALLKSLCVYRQSTAEAVRHLYENDNIGEELHKLFSHGEDLHAGLAQIPEKNIKILKERLKDVYSQITQCELQYGR